MKNNSLLLEIFDLSVSESRSVVVMHACFELILQDGTSLIEITTLHTQNFDRVWTKPNKINVCFSTRATAANNWLVSNTLFPWPVCRCESLNTSQILHLPQTNGLTQGERGGMTLSSGTFLRWEWMKTECVIVAKGFPQFGRYEGCLFWTVNVPCPLLPLQFGQWWGYNTYHILSK